MPILISARPPGKSKVVSLERADVNFKGEKKASKMYVHILTDVE